MAAADRPGVVIAVVRVVTAVAHDGPGIVRMTDPRMTGLVDRIYDAAVDLDLWPGVLEEVANLVGAAGAALIVQHQESGEGDGVFVGVDPSVKALYFGDYKQRNAIRARNSPDRLRNYTPRVVTDRDIMPKVDFLGTEYYNEFLRRYDIYSVMMLGLEVRDLSVATLNVIRPAHRAEFDEPEIRLGAVLQPHLIRAFRLARKLGEGARASDGWEAFLDRSAYGVLVLSAAGSIRHANRAAEAILARRDGLEIVRGRLTSSTPETTRLLQDLISAAASSDPAVRRGGSVALQRPSLAPPLLATVSPVRSDSLALFNGGPSVLVCVSDPDARLGLPDDLLRQAFGLTRAEAKVALQLLEGKDLKQAAADLGLSFFTVRAHLVRIFEKTRTSRQAELVGLLTRVSAMSGV